jgi:hypothetical protein
MTNVEVYHKMAVYTKKIAYGTSGNALNRPEYVGWAAPGTAADAQGWLIQKMTYSSGGMVTDVKWADSELTFDKIWDSRAGYTYG